ncbi:MAG: hypothetical protein ABL958_04160, partial [Bdellovibrionia bacterium]
MKFFKHFSLMAALLFTMIPVANASKARLTALGQDRNGSLFVDDERNVFLNPAYMGKLRNLANFELGATGVSGNPKAEGGLVYDLGNLRAGAELGRVNRATESILSASALATTAFFAPQNSVELLVGAGGDLNWGASLHYANSKSDRGVTADFPDSEASVTTVTGGVLTDLYGAYLALDMVAKSETKDVGGATEKYAGKTG